MVGWCFSADDASAVDCLFVGNSSNNWGGGAAVSMPGSFVNCAFSRNSAVLVGGGAYLMAEPEAEPAFVNCTFSGNEGGGVGLFQSEPALVNCVSWGNTPGEILVDPESWPCVPTISFSDIQGGWTGPGANNIDADPLFVQPGMDNLRLGFGSPCVNAGDNAAVPPGILYDIYGVDRFIDGIVDMGACEGEYEQLPEGVIEYGLDPGDFAILVPSGGSAFDPPAAAGVLIVNVSGPDNATVQVLQFPDTQHPGAEGFASLGANLELDTSMSNGQFSALVYIPFDEDDLGGADPLTVDLTYFDETVGNWGLAASHNTQNSPGHGGPIGDRIVVGSGGGWGITPQLGDYGVYWDPAAAAGFAWARVDFAGDFAFGWPLCPGDCHQPPDGVVNVIDLNAALAAWGFGAGPFDVNNDGVVNMLDILDLLAVWGVCP